MKNNGNIINLQDHRVRRRKRYLAQHGDRLDSFIGDFLDHNMAFDLNDLSKMYMIASQQDSGQWCHFEFRDIVSRAIEHSVGEGLIAALKANRWFDESFISTEEVFDRSTSYFILRAGRVANI
ncbi:hypothetical protein N9D31_00920 [Oligoflexaceae bacterium]|nr:hypothetical protein [Oligoflexaceae bacterium]